MTFGRTRDQHEKIMICRSRGRMKGSGGGMQRRLWNANREKESRDIRCHLLWVRGTERVNGRKKEGIPMRNFLCDAYINYYSNMLPSPGQRTRLTSAQESPSPLQCFHEATSQDYIHRSMRGEWMRERTAWDKAVWWREGSSGQEKQQIWQPCFHEGTWWMWEPQQ